MTKENNKKMDVEGMKENELWSVLSEISDRFENAIKNKEKTH